MLWILSTAVFLLFASLTFAVCYAGSPHSLIQGNPRRRAISAGTGLGVRVELHDTGVLVRWNPGIIAMRSGVKGLLQIEDGTRQDKLRLDSDQLTNGSVMYKPIGNSVTFR